MSGDSGLRSLVGKHVGPVNEVGIDRADLEFVGLSPQVFVVEEPWATAGVLAEADDDAVDGRRVPCFGGPCKGPVGEFDVPPGPVDLGEEAMYLVALRDGVGGHERPRPVEVAEVLQGAGVPSGDVVHAAEDLVAAPCRVELGKLLGGSCVVA